MLCAGKAQYRRSRLTSNVRPQNRTPGSHTMSTQHHCVSPVSLPPESRIAKAYASTNLADAYSVELSIWSVNQSRTVGEVHLLPPSTVDQQPHRGPRCDRRQVRPQNCQATHFTWCAEQDRSCRHLQDLQHQSDRNCPRRRRQALGLQALCPLFQSAVARRQTATDFVNRGPLPQPPRSSLYSCHRPVPPLGRSIQSS